MSTAKLIIGDVLEVLRSMPDDSVDLVLTSPPFLALRSYLPADHPDKAKELGSEPTPGAFIDSLLDVVEEVRRVLAPHGSLCIELGDTYAGSGGGGGDYLPGGMREGQPGFTGSAGKDTEAQREANAAHWRQKNAWKKDAGSGGAGGDYGENGLREGQPRFKVRTDGGRFPAGYQVVHKDGKVQSPKAEDYAAHEVRPVKGRQGWPQDKSLTLVPELFRISLAYGVNPLTGRTTEPWRIRNVIRWVRPNPPVGALGDKFRPATSEMVVACMSRSRYFDLDAVRVPVTEAEWKKAGQKSGESYQGTAADWNGYQHTRVREPHPAGAPPLDWWAIPTEPYPGSHYATWPRDLLVKPIKAMCPEKVCRVCGEPSRRVVESERVVAYPPKGSNGARITGGEFGQEGHSSRTTVGWSDCGHDDWRPGLVCDPFGGSGTTGAVATGHGRDAVLIDIDERNAELAQQRIGMFLTVEHFKGEHVA